jgi:hypothetical protein
MSEDQASRIATLEHQVQLLADAMKGLLTLVRESESAKSDSAFTARERADKLDTYLQANWWGQG